MESNMFISRLFSFPIRTRANVDFQRPIARPLRKSFQYWRGRKLSLWLGLVWAFCRCAVPCCSPPLVNALFLKD